MKNFSFTPRLIFTFVLILNACSAAPTAAPAPTSVPFQEPSPTAKPLQLTPVESAFAPGNPTAAPPDEIPAPRTVDFDTPDGVAITGELYGSGETAVIFSVMGNCKPGWRQFTQLTAAQVRSVMALTYRWRDCGESGPISETELSRNFLNDARGAIDFVREQGAEKIILAGASLGGMASAKLAVESQASGLIVFASPSEIAQWDFKIEAPELNTDIPKLFLIAENDTVVPLDAARELYELASEPKEWQTYPGDEHGTDLFSSSVGEAVQQRILEFILAVVSTP